MASKAAYETCRDPAECMPRDWVISIPSYYTDSQRRAFFAGCQMAGVTGVQRLMNKTTMTTLAYGIFKNMRQECSADSPTHGMFVNMGALTYSVAVVDFRPGKLVVKSALYDPDLGGRDFDYVITEWIATRFKEKYRGEAQRQGP